MYPLLSFWIASTAAHAGLAPGEIAVIAYNADGDDDFAIVLLAEVSNETVYFTDKEYDGVSTFTIGEGYLRWDSGPTALPAGTVVAFNDVLATPLVTHGTLSFPNASFNLAADGDNLLVYQGTTHTAPAVFLYGLEYGAGQIGSLAGTGLQAGTTYASVSAGAHDDGGVYAGPRIIGTGFDSFLPRIGAAGWWQTATSDGEALLPYDLTPFLADAPQAVPVLGGWGLLALGLGLGGAGASALRRDDAQG